MVLTRQEKERLILDLYNQGKTYKQIAETVRVSPRDIKPVLERAEKERERKLGINTHEEESNVSTGNQQKKEISSFSQAYHLFSEGKTPLDVAIELNLKEREATKYYREYWRLSQLHSLDEIYEDIGNDIIYIIKLHRKMRSAGIGVEQVINLTKIANYDLPALEQKYQRLQREVNLLESKKLEEYRTLNDLQDQIDRSEKMLEWLEISCQEGEANIDKLEKEEIRLERLVKNFKDNNEEYRKIKKTAAEQVIRILFDGKRLLHLALYSLMESMRIDPQKYHGQQLNSSFNSFYDEYESTLLENAEKLYSKLIKEWTEQILKEYSIRSCSSNDKLEERKQQLCYKPFKGLSQPKTTSDNQAIHVRGVRRIFVRTEL